MNLGEAAAFLAGSWPVFPCLANKRPATEHGFKDAVRDAAAARALFRARGAAMIGVPTGRASGLLVIDLDVKDGRFGLEWLAAQEHRMPPTRRHSTVNGGVHLLFRYPDHLDIGSGVGGAGRFRMLPAGVDVRGEGGYIISPPSPGYAITTDTMPAEAPAWLLDLLNPPPEPARPAAPARPLQSGDGSAWGLKALANECDAIRTAAEGQKHYTLNRAAYSIGGLVAAGELVEGAARRALDDALAAIRDRCEDYRAAEKTLRTAFEDGKGAPRQAPPPRQREHVIRIEVGSPDAVPWDAAPEHLTAEPEVAPPRQEPAARPKERVDPETGEVVPVTALRWTDQPWDEAAIPKRPWVVPGYLLRGSVTLAAGVGSAGKSSLMCGWSCAAALGETLGRFAPLKPLRVLTYNVEDDDAEQRRRLSAALKQFGRTPRDLAGRVMRVGPEDIGTLVEHDLMTGRFRLTDAWHELEALCEEWKPDLVILDPLAELHTAEENNNTALRHVIAYVRGMARRHNLSAAVIHHFRKGGEAGDMDAIRGAGAIVGAVRVALTVTPMTKEEAAEFGIDPELRRRFVRVDNAKANYSPPGEAEWYELTGYELDNGEEVAAAIPWAPRQAKRSGPEAQPEVFALIAAEVARGTPSGPFSARLAPDQPRSVAAVMVRRGIVSAAGQKAILQRLLAEGFTVEEWRDADGDKRKGLRSPEGTPETKWVGGSEE